MKNIRVVLLAFLLMFIGSSKLYAAFDYYWVGDSTQNGSGQWDSLSNWVHVFVGGSPNGAGTPSVLPGSDDNIFIKDTTGIQLSGRHIEIWAGEINVKSLTVDLDSLSFYFDEAEVSGDINFASTGNRFYELAPNFWGTAYLISSPDSGESSSIYMAGVNYKKGDFIKVGQGISYISNDLSLDIDTSEVSGGGNMMVSEGTLNLLFGVKVHLNNMIFDGDSIPRVLEPLPASEIHFYGNNEHDFTELDSLASYGDASFYFHSSYENNHHHLFLSSHTYDNIFLETSSYIHDNPTIRFLNLSSGNNYNINSQSFVTINDEITINGDSSKYTILASTVPKNSADLILVDSNNLQVTLRNLIIKDINLKQSDVTLDNSVDMGGNSSNWIFNNKPTAKSFYYKHIISYSKWSEIGNWFINDTSQAHRLPLPIDTVIFDENSFSYSNSIDTVFLEDGLFFCKDMLWQNMTSYTSPPVMMMKNAQLAVNGSIDLDENMIIDFDDMEHDQEDQGIFFVSDTNETIRTSENHLNIDFIFKGAGSWTLKDNLNLNNMYLDVESGEFNSDGYTISVGSISDGYMDEDMFANQLYPSINIDHSLVNLNDDDEPFAIFKDSTKVSAQNTDIVLHSDSIWFFAGNSKFGSLTSKADLNYFASSDTFGILSVLAGSHNYIGDSITINEHLFIEDTSSNVTTFSYLTYFDSSVVASGGPSMTAGSLGSYKAKIHNNSPNDICLENVSMNFVDVISDSTVMNYIKGDTSDTTNSENWILTNDKCYMDLFGSVEDDNSDVFSEGHVILFKLNPNSTAMFDTLKGSSIDSMGKFMFNNLSSADYMLKVNPKPSSGFMSAYYPDITHWSEADTISLTSDTSGIVITVSQPPAPPSPGTPGATITGKLDTTVKSPTPYLNIASGLRGPSEVFDSVVIGIIEKGTGDLIMLDTTDNNGFFTFNDVPSGQYRLMPDIAGIQVDTTGLNVINVGSATDSFNFVFEVDSNLIYVADTSSGTLVSTSFLEQNESVLKLWPNPVRGQLNILSEEYIREIRLYDQLMREISTEGYATGSNQYILDLSGLKRGIYLLRINGMNVKHRILKL